MIYNEVFSYRDGELEGRRGRCKGNSRMGGEKFFRRLEYGVDLRMIWFRSIVVIIVFLYR